ncbi:La protein -like protein [Phanerochaete sordida]|uniref:La protein -like protein n=1 Tax=Phanerochaete sordida TaxID=48140 RepID=A0A9P3G1S1_9APHY|nr:La protein -like protein [Phanerochaete sordida]
MSLGLTVARLLRRPQTTQLCRQLHSLRVPTVQHALPSYQARLRGRARTITSAAAPAVDDASSPVLDLEAGEEKDEQSWWLEEDGAPLKMDAVSRAARQVEFYLSDGNLPYDKYMWDLYTANPEHWVPIATIANFARMREFLPQGPEWLVDVLKGAPSLEVDETNTFVRRKTEVTQLKDQVQRTVYVTGFGEYYHGMQREIEPLFNKIGRTNAVRLRREAGTDYTEASAFVEFSHQSTATKLVNTTRELRWKGRALHIIPMEEYCKTKVEEQGLTGDAAQRYVDAIVDAVRGSFNAFRQSAQGASDEAVALKPVVWIQYLGQRIRAYEEDGGSVRPEDVVPVRGATLQFAPVLGGVSFNEILPPLKERFGYAPWIEYTRGDTSGYVAFEKALSQDDVTFIADKLGTLNSRPVQWSFLDEETEKNFQIARAHALAKRAFWFANNESQAKLSGSWTYGRSTHHKRGRRH